MYVMCLEETPLKVLLPPLHREWLFNNAVSDVWASVGRFCRHHRKFPSSLSSSVARVGTWLASDQYLPARYVAIVLWSMDTTADT